ALDVWRVACLGNTLNHRDSAEALCNEMLMTDRANPRALIWALARNYKIDTSVCESALKEAIGLKPPASLPEQIERIIALVLIYILSERATDAHQLLDSTKDLFPKPADNSLWLFWYTQVLVAEGDPERALTLLTSNVDARTRCQIETTARRAIAARLDQ